MRRVPESNDEDGFRLTHGVVRGAPFRIYVDNRPTIAYPGETVAGVLFAAGRRPLRRTGLEGAPRGVYCGMGVCFDCLVTVNGETRQRACTIPAEPEMQIRTGGARQETAAG